MTGKVLPAEVNMESQTTPSAIESAYKMQGSLESEQKHLARLTVLVSVVAVFVAGMQTYVAKQQMAISAAQAQNERESNAEEIRALKRQTDISHAQMISSYIPQLADDRYKDAAIVSMKGLVSDGQIRQLAGAFKATGALQQIAESGQAGEQSKAEDLLEEFGNAKRKLLTRMFGDDKKDRIAATTELQLEWRGDASLVPEAIAFAMERTTHKSGVINTLVLVRDFPVEVLRANSDGLEEIFKHVWANGPTTQGFIKQIRSKIGENFGQATVER